MDTKVYFEISEDINALLTENGIKISKLLEDEGINASVTYGVAPYQSENGVRTKNLIEIASLIAASSGAIVTIGWTICKILNTIYKKPYFVSFYENEELRDSNGNILLDNEGKPIFKAKKINQIIEPEKEFKKEIIDFKTGFKNGVVLKIESEDQINQSK